MLQITKPVYEQLFKSATDSKGETTSIKKITNPCEIPDITVEKMDIALNIMKNSTAPGEDGITVEMMKYSGAHSKQKL